MHGPERALSGQPAGLSKGCDQSNREDNDCLQYRGGQEAQNKRRDTVSESGGLRHGSHSWKASHDTAAAAGQEEGTAYVWHRSHRQFDHNGTSYSSRTLSRAGRNSDRSYRSRDARRFGQASAAPRSPPR